MARLLYIGRAGKMMGKRFLQTAESLWKAEWLWCTPLLPELRRQRQDYLLIPCQPGIHREFWDIPAYIERPCLKKGKKNTKGLRKS